MISYTLNARKNTIGHITVQDMVLLKVSLNGLKVDTIKWLICKMIEIRNDEFEIVFAMLIPSLP